MNISRGEIRGAAKRARLNEIVYINGERLIADEIGITGKYIYTYAGHPGFTSVDALVKFIQAGAAEGPTTPPTKPDGVDVATNEDGVVAGSMLHAAMNRGKKPEGIDISFETDEQQAADTIDDINALLDEKVVPEVDDLTEQNKLAIAAFIDEVNASIGHAPPATAFGEKKAERRIRSHRRRLRKSGLVKGTPIIDTYA